MDIDRGKRIFGARKKKGMSQTALGKLINAEQSYISKLEKGYAISLDQVKEIAYHLNEDPMWLYYGNNIPNNENESNIVNDPEEIYKTKEEIERLKEELKILKIRYEERVESLKDIGRGMEEARYKISTLKQTP